MKIAPSEALASLGFTGLESEIYAFLLTESPATGYRIAQAIGKQVANVYKAIQTLESKGAVTVDTEASRQCAPIPVADLIGRISGDFERRRNEAQATLLALHTKTEPSARIYTLQSREAAVQQARALVAEAKDHLAIRLGGSFGTDLKQDCAAAAERGVHVTAAPALDWLGDEISLAVDGSAALVAKAGPGDSAQGYWCRSAYLAQSLHQGLAADACLAEIHAEIEDGAGAKRISRALAGLESASKTAGAKEVT